MAEKPDEIDGSDGPSGEGSPSAGEVAARSRRLDYACMAGVALPMLVIYFLCACRTVFVGDSGELAAVAATYGVPHPSGYPLYALTAGSWVRLFAFGSEAFAANTFSGLCSAAALAVLTGFLLDVLKDRPGRRAAAVGTALLAGLSVVWWQESTVARVYHLNSLCSIALFWAAWRAGAARTPKWLILTGGLAGLALANHLASVGAVLGAAAMWVAARWRAYRDAGGADGVAGWARLEWRNAAAGSAAVLPGLLLYLWLPIRYSQDPLVKWKPIVGLGDLVAYVLRSDYAGRSWTAGSPVKALHGIFHGIWVIGAELTPVGLALAVAGAILFRKQRPLLIGLAVWFLVFSWLFVTHGQRRDIFLWDRYWLPGMLAVAVLTGLGLQAALARITQPKAHWAVVLVLPVVMLIGNWERCDRSSHTLARDVAARLLENVKDNTYFVADGDNIGFPVLYLLASKEMQPKGLMPYFPGMQPGVQMRLPPEAVRAGCVVWTHPPDWPADNRMQMETLGLLGVGRMRDQVPWQPVPWERWAVASAENARPRDEIYESHERELLSHYFTMKGRALARVDAAAADAALQRAEHYAHLNEYSMLKLRDALHALGRTDWANRLHAETMAFAPMAVRQYTPPAEQSNDLPGNLPPGPAGPGGGR